MTVTPAADAYVSSAKTTTNFGTATALKAGTSPTYRSYLRFNVTISGTVTQALLRLYSTASTQTGFDVWGVPSTSWSETAVTYANAPALAATKTASSGAVSTAVWVSLNVTPLVKASGAVSVALTSTAKTALQFASREATNKPQLVITTAPTVPGAPTGASAVPHDSSATVTWQAPSSTGGAPITGYRVVANPGATVTTAPATPTSVTVTGLNNGTAYTFTVAATNSAGTGPASTASNAVTPVATLPPPVAHLLVTPTNGTAPLAVSVTDQSSGTVTNRLWNFGDGATATSASASHTYTAPGTYQVSLTVTNASGSNTATQAVVVSALPAPTAAFTTSTSTGIAPLNVTFHDTSTGSIDTWAWDFGDGSTSTTQSPTHTYTAPGTYPVTLTVTNAGGSNTARHTVVVSALPAPTAGFTTSTSTGVAPLNVTFHDTSTGSIDTWAWDFGDGTTSTTQNPAHTYTQVGSYTAQLTVTNAAGTSSINATISVDSPPPPAAAFNLTPTTGTAPLTVTVADTSTGTPTAWTWDFGDGTDPVTGTAATTHVYQAPGSYSVSLTVTNTGGVDTARHTVAVSALPAPTAGFTTSTSTGVAPLNVTFHDTSTGSIDTWAWDFGDGTTSTTQNPAHTYTQVGSYTAQLTVTNAAGTSSINATISVDSPPPPAAAFNLTPTTGTAPLTVTVADTSTGTPTAWTWDFGDGTDPVTGTAATTHVYLAPGSFVVTLTASNQYGATTTSHGVAVTATPRAPDPPTGASAVLVPGTPAATLSFAAPVDDGGWPIDKYRITSSPAVGGGWIATASPVTVNDLTLGTTYTFTVAAHNVNGWSAESTATNSLTVPVPSSSLGNVSFMTSDQLASLPASGPLWDKAKAVADAVKSGKPATTCDIANIDSRCGVLSLTTALVLLRSGDTTYLQPLTSYMTSYLGHETSTSQPLNVYRQIAPLFFTVDLLKRAGMWDDNLAISNAFYVGTWTGWVSGRSGTWTTGDAAAHVPIQDRVLPGQTNWNTLEKCAATTANNWGSVARAGEVAVADVTNDATLLGAALTHLHRFLGDTSYGAPFTRTSEYDPTWDNWSSAAPTATAGIGQVDVLQPGRDGAIIEDVSRSPGPYDATNANTHYGASTAGLTYPLEAVEYVYAEYAALKNGGYPVDTWGNGGNAMHRLHDWLIRAFVYDYAMNQTTFVWYATHAYVGEKLFGDVVPNKPPTPADKFARCLPFGDWLAAATNWPRS